MAMWHETKHMTLYEGEGDSCHICPSILDNQNALIQYNIPDRKKKGKNKEVNEKTIAKMLRKKLTRYVDKKYKNNIKRKATEYNF